MRCLRLPFTFDPEKLRADLARVHDEDWQPHLNRHVYEGEWSGAALRAIGGDGTNIVPEALHGGQFADTALLARCSYFQHVLAQFRCPLLAVRLLRLKAGSHVGEHVDHGLDFDDGEVRIHVPIVTSDAVKFFLDGARLVMAPGACWYTNVHLPHAVENHGAIDRIHLVIDCTVDPWLRDLFARAPRAPDGAQMGRLAVPGPIEPAQFYHICHQVARRCVGSPRCTVEARQVVFSWRDIHTWQIRVGTAFLPGSAWSASWETSPAAAPALAARIEQFVAAFGTEMPGLLWERTSAP
jgi:hypothetical protein